MDISREETVRRLSARRICTKCGTTYNLITNIPKSDLCDCGGKLIQRDDDYPEAIEKRLAEYHKNTDPMVSLVEKQGLLHKIDGNRPIETISNEIMTVIEAKNG